jgi:methionine sulfoxide reductase heme-binding subunit
MRHLGSLVHAFLKSRWFYPLVFLACLSPGAGLVRDTVRGDLGVNPVETLLHETGRAALGILLCTLAITPIRRLTGWNRVQVVRRMMGVWSFFYALCHFLIYFVFDQVGDVGAIGADVAERPFITMGMLALVILLALAVTSTNGMIRRLRRNWQRLHRLVYVAAIAGIVHFTWGQKADIEEPLLWASALAVLLGFRVVRAIRQRQSRQVRAVTH